VLLALGFSAAIAAQSKPADVESTLRELELRLAEAWVKGDRAFIEGLLSDDWTVTDPAGRILTKRQVLEETFSSRDRRIEAMTIDDVRVRLLDRAAVVTGRTRATGSYRGEKATVILRFTDVFHLRNGRWQIVASQGATVAQ
jgi:hypothetical protein